MTNRQDALGTSMALIFSAASFDSFLSTPSAGQPWVDRPPELLPFSIGLGSVPDTPFCQTTSFPMLASLFMGRHFAYRQFTVSPRFRQSRASGDGPRSRRVCPSHPLRPVGNCGPVQTDHKEVGASPRVFRKGSSYPPVHCTLTGELLAAAYGDGIVLVGIQCNRCCITHDDWAHSTVPMTMVWLHFNAGSCRCITLVWSDRCIDGLGNGDCSIRSDRRIRCWSGTNSLQLSLLVCNCGFLRW